MLANHVVGTGPRLQMLTDDPQANRVIEKEFSRWAKAVGTSRELRSMRITQCEPGPTAVFVRARSLVIRQPGPRSSWRIRSASTW